MPELWDIYDRNRNKTGKFAQRDVDWLQEGEYHLVVTAIIINSKNEILLSQRASFKKHPLLWECNGGSVLAGENTLEGAVRELKEELGIDVTKEEAIFFKEIRRNKIPGDFKDIWVFKKDIDIKEIVFPDGEAIDAKWVTVDEFVKMFDKKEIVPTIDIGREELEKAIELIKNKKW